MVQPGTTQVILPNEYPDYSKIEYWNNRYKDEKGQTFEWYVGYQGLRDIIVPRLFDDKEAELMIIGCGNSGKQQRYLNVVLELGEKMYEDGFHYITNSDYSSIILEEMKDRNAHLDEMDYVEMDISEPCDILDSDSFTCIIDKAVFDCVVCSEQYLKKTKQMIDNIHRILAPGGCYICVSQGRPETRLGYFKQADYKWNVESVKIAKKSSMELFERIDQEPYYYVYICTKKY